MTLENTSQKAGAGQRWPVPDVATVVQYDTIAERGIDGTRPAAPDGVVNRGNRQILDKLYIDFFTEGVVNLWNSLASLVVEATLRLIV